FFQAEDGIRYFHVTGVQTCALPIYKDGDAGVLGEDYDRFRALRPKVEAAGFYWTESLERPGGNPFRGGNRVKIRRSQVNHTNVEDRKSVVQGRYRYPIVAHDTQHEQ